MNAVKLDFTFLSNADILVKINYERSEVSDYLTNNRYKWVILASNRYYLYQILYSFKNKTYQQIL
jgi:hypothetical protein